MPSTEIEPFSSLEPYQSDSMSMDTPPTTNEPNAAAVYEARRRQTITGGSSAVLDNIVQGSNCKTTRNVGD